MLRLEVEAGREGNDCSGITINESFNTNTNRNAQCANLRLRAACNGNGSSSNMQRKKESLQLVSTKHPAGALTSLPAVTLLAGAGDVSGSSSENTQRLQKKARHAKQVAECLRFAMTGDTWHLLFTYKKPLLQTVRPISCFSKIFHIFQKFPIKIHINYTRLRMTYLQG